MGNYLDPLIPTLDISDIGGRDNFTAVKLAETRTLLAKRKTEIRHRAWEKLMIIGINAAIKLEHISLAPDGNFWQGAPTEELDSGNGLIFRVSVSGIPAIVQLASIGHGELAIKVALWPSESAENRIHSFGMFSGAGAISASGWLERKNGKWLQANKASARKPFFYCADYLLESVANLDVDPLGFERSGKVMM